MGNGYLGLHVCIANNTCPVCHARITIRKPDETILYDAITDRNGNTEFFQLSAPDASFSLEQDPISPVYSLVNVVVEADGCVRERIDGIEIADGKKTILPVCLYPITSESNPVVDYHITIPKVNITQGVAYKKVGAGHYSVDHIEIPAFITVHLGEPMDNRVPDIRIPFIDYIKNVTASEVYPTWPYHSLVANIYAIVTFALNRIYSKWYRNQGYDFDITCSPEYDMCYRKNGPVFENMNSIVDNMFHVYAHIKGDTFPYFTEFCNGVFVTCSGMHQWETVSLAEQGKTPLEILRDCYTDKLELKADSFLQNIEEQYPDKILMIGSSGESVHRMQKYLNQIRKNYQEIPLIEKEDGEYGYNTNNAVKGFQKAFQLIQSGNISKRTWYQISYLYANISNFIRGTDENNRFCIGYEPPVILLTLGSKDKDVEKLQYLVNRISLYYSSVSPVNQNGIYDRQLEISIRQFQITFGLTSNGRVGPNTWNKLYCVYHGIRNMERPANYQGELRNGSTESNVRLIQQYLSDLRIKYPNLAPITVDGIFGPNTKEAVMTYQEQFHLPPDGIVDQKTWDEIVSRWYENK
ncbi:MAG: peptidoglycan-binding protein [Lachnoclostridium sp.]|nr:peptidoglycan-binding protein [Lachnoclostridium sp.]